MFIQFADGIQKFQVTCNTGQELLLSNVSANLGHPEIEVGEATDRPAIIVGGGPSVAGLLDRIREIKADDGVIFALNNAAKYLIENGIQPNFQIILDARQGNAEFVGETPCLLGSQCHPDVFAKAKSLTMWHPIIEGIQSLAPKSVLIGGGTTVGLSGMCLVYTLGYRNIHLFGYDSCYGLMSAAGKAKPRAGYEQLNLTCLASHAYPQELNVGQQTMDVTVNGRTFKASAAMSAQAQKFPYIALELAELGCEIYPHGDGLLQHMVKTMQEKALEKPLTAIYDLASSPPTYDFLSFLGEAENARVKGGYTHLDVIFQPGPVGGFRADKLPPDVAEREGMLHRICVSACRLLPSVRNVEVLKERKDVDGAVFPHDWANDYPVSHYGVKYFKSGPQALRATESAKRVMFDAFPRSYATITVREADYWPERNSNMTEWKKAAKWLEKYMQVVFVPDTANPTFGYIPAAFDIDLRMALYERATLNLMVINGPFELCRLSKAPYILFKPITQACHSTSKEFLAANGVNEGDQYSDNGKVVWADDDAETIISEVSDFLQLNSLR